MRVKNQMSWRGTRTQQPKPVQNSTDFHKRQPVNSQPIGVSDLRERQSTRGLSSLDKKEGKSTNS
jgi:hypothetical protein